MAGKVQGVFFRASTAQVATRLGLRGYARNLADGRVEVVAAGDAARLGELHAWLREGPPRARVSGVEASDLAPADVAGLDGFRTG